MIKKCKDPNSVDLFNKRVTGEKNAISEGKSRL